LQNWKVESTVKTENNVSKKNENKNVQKQNKKSQKQRMSKNENKTTLRGTIGPP